MSMLVTGADLAQARPFGGLSVRTDIRGLIRPADIRRIPVFLCADFHTILYMIVYKMITILHK